MANYYEWYKTHGICPKCKVNNAFSGHVFCAECLEKIRLNNFKYVDKREEYNMRGNERKKTLYKERKEKGLCTTCGKKKQHGQLCNECWMKKMRRRRNSKEYLSRNGRKCGDAFRERMERGECMYCGKKQVSGHKLCKDCLERQRKLAKHMRETSPGTWRKEIDRQWQIAKLTHSKNG